MVNDNELHLFPTPTAAKRNSFRKIRLVLATA
jgi:hypothetical protein